MQVYAYGIRGNVHKWLHSYLMNRNQYVLYVLLKPVELLFTKIRDYHIYNTRHSEALHTARGNNEFHYKTLSFCAIQIWNKLSRNVPTDVSYTCFKHMVKFYVQTTSINNQPII